MDYYDNAISFKNLYKGLKRSCRNVRWKDSVVGYENNGLKNTLKLSNDLKTGKYKISKYQKFTIYEPKKREIVATRLVDRQFQRSLCDSGLYQDITEHFIRDNVACMEYKGTDMALNRLKIHLRRHYRKHGTDGWVLKCDIHHFFQETRHDVAKSAVRKYVSNKRSAEAVCNIIDSFEGDKGIGLGSQVSQLVELLVLNDLDHYIKERLHIRGYVRYMDDFILIHESKEHLQMCRTEIERFLDDIGLRLNRKTSLFPIRHGIIFLKWRLVLTDSGKVKLLMDGNKVSKIKRSMRKLWEREKKGEAPHGTTRRYFGAALCNAFKGDTYRIREALIHYYDGLTGGRMV